jgi:hypothetical protein
VVFGIYLSLRLSDVNDCCHADNAAQLNSHSNIVVHYRKTLKSFVGCF